LRLGYGREQKTENSKGQNGWFHSKFTHKLPQRTANGPLTAELHFALRMRFAG
jgi:hypothetical protein